MKFADLKFADLIVAHARALPPRFQHLVSFPSRPVAAAVATPRHTRSGAAVQSPQRTGRVPPPASGGRRGRRFDHLGNLVDYGGGAGSRLTEPQMQALWAEAFRRVGVDVDAGRSGNRRPARNRAEANWDEALVRAGLIKAN